jgi:hypothetical protein
MVHGWQHYGAMLQPFAYARRAFHEQMHRHPKNHKHTFILEKKLLCTYRLQHKGSKLKNIEYASIFLIEG